MDLIGAAWPYATLFALAFIAATVLPAQSELVLGAMLVSGRFSTPLLLVVATAGNTLGSCLNWLLGRFIQRFQDRRWFPVKPAALARAEAWYATWGKWSLLFSWTPVIGDALTVVAGVLRTRFTTFLLIMLVAKAGRYIVVAGAVLGLL